MDALAKFAPFVVAVIGLLIAIWKQLIEFSRGKQGNLRDEYRFSREFFSDLAAHPQMHPFLREKGFQAVSGGTDLSGSEREYFLELHGSVNALRNFISGRKYLDFHTTVATHKVRFKKRYMQRWSRLWRKSMYGLTYFICASLAMSPLLLPSIDLLSADKSFVALVVTVPIFLPSAFLALKAAVRINHAENLVKNQVKHSVGVYVKN